MLKKIFFNQDNQLRDLESQADMLLFFHLWEMLRYIKSLEEESYVKDKNTSLPIANLYESLETLGNDRIAVVVGAAIQFPKENVLVIDAGTCITLDLLTTEGYQGGSIAPGIHMRLQTHCINKQKIYP